MKLNLRDVRVQLASISAVLALVAILALSVLLSPAVRARQANELLYQQLQAERDSKKLAIAPAVSLDKQLEESREQQDDFARGYLPTRYSTMSEQLAQLAKRAGVRVLSVHYNEHAEQHNAPAGYDQLSISIEVSGNYEQDMHFINEVERQHALLLIDGVSFSGMSGNRLTVAVNLSTYLLRSAA